MIFDRDYSNVFFLICNTPNKHELETDEVYRSILEAFKAQWQKERGNNNHYIICCDPNSTDIYSSRYGDLFYLNHKSYIFVIGHSNPGSDFIRSDADAHFHYSFFAKLFSSVFYAKRELCWRPEDHIPLPRPSKQHPTLSCGNRNVRIDFTPCSTAIRTSTSPSFIEKFYRSFLSELSLNGVGGTPIPLAQQGVPIFHVRGALGFTIPIDVSGGWFALTRIINKHLLGRKESELGAHSRVSLPFGSSHLPWTLPFYPYMPNNYTHQIIAINHKRMKEDGYYPGRPITFPNTAHLFDPATPFPVPSITLTPEEDEKYYERQQTVERILY